MSEEQAPYGVSYIADRPTISFVEDTKVARFREIVDKMAETYAKKNSDYGNSFNISVRKYGNIAALTRMSDKFNRIENLILNGNQQVKDESLLDSLKDLGCYCVMTIMAIEENNAKKIQ